MPFNPSSKRSSAKLASGQTSRNRQSRSQLHHSPNRSRKKRLSQSHKGKEQQQQHQPRRGKLCLLETPFSRRHTLEEL